MGKELSFIDAALREIVAEVSEAHGYNIADIYYKNKIKCYDNKKEERRYIFICHSYNTSRSFYINKGFLSVIHK